MNEKAYLTHTPFRESCKLKNSVTPNYIFANISVTNREIELSFWDDLEPDIRIRLRLKSRNRKNVSYAYSHLRRIFSQLLTVSI